jgi:uncharacterized membrane protein YphA (DoxX/SURF4 family)
MQIQLPIWTPILARTMFVTYFITMGMSHLVHFRTHAQFIRGKGVPLAAGTTALTVVTMVIGGLLLLLNWHTLIGAAQLFGIILPAPFFLHHFWKETDSYARLSEFAHFFKDLSLAGAALLLMIA